MTKISTHTLTWSVTRSSAGRPDRTEYFNSHAHVERDNTEFDTDNMVFNFNSHAHVERDIAKTISEELKTNFNSHAHVERDNVA